MLNTKTMDMFVPGEKKSINHINYFRYKVFKTNMELYSVFFIGMAQYFYAVAVPMVSTETDDFQKTEKLLVAISMVGVVLLIYRYRCTYR